MKMTVKKEVETPKSATHYRGDPLDVDDVSWFKTIEVAGVPIWFFLGDHGVWFMSGENTPEGLIEIGECDG
jgi:hypothetical protein